MASKRQKKKQERKQLLKALDMQRQVAAELTSDIYLVDREISKLKAKLKEKNKTLQELRDQLSQTTSLIEKITVKSHMYNPNLTLQDLDQAISNLSSKAGSRTQSHATQYVLIKHYYDLINDGIIKEQEIFDKYAIADYMERVLSDQELFNLEREATIKEQELWEKSKQKKRERDLTVDMSDILG